MQLVAFNSTPRDAQTSKTDLLLKAFLAGAQEAGADCELFYLRNYKIMACQGCFGCWTKTPGRCGQSDDMTNLLFPKFIQADIAVLASPLYYFSMNACLKAFVDRTLPMFEPKFTDSGEETGHPLRFGRMPKIVTLSVCAYPDPDSFRALALNWNMVFGPYLTVEIYRHSSEFFEIPDLAPMVKQILEGAYQAGIEMVRSGQIAGTTLKQITQDLAPRASLIEMANRYWRQVLPENEK
jgi:multimeric flavodoxin WrbA